MTITVVNIASIEVDTDGAVSARRFLSSETVGAQLVEGLAYQLSRGAHVEFGSEGRHQVFYVTSGRVRAVHDGSEHDLTVGRGVYCEPGEACALETAGDAPATFYRFLVKST